MTEAVFSSKLTQLDVNRGNIYDSYPLVQKLSGPDTPQMTLSPNPTYIRLGTIAGSLLISSAIIAYTFRPSRRLQGVSIHSWKLSISPRKLFGFRVYLFILFIFQDSYSYSIYYSFGY